MAPFDSPIGPLVVAWNGLGVCAVDLAGRRPAARARHEARTGRARPRPTPLPAGLADAIARRLDGDRRVRIDLDLRGHTDFERDVWPKALEIPRGEVRPYGWIAAEIGRPKAVRAVGTALGHNPVPLIVPCHRVVRTDGTIGQYCLGGLRQQADDPRSGGPGPGGPRGRGPRGERLLGSGTTRIVCWPTCRNARRIDARNRVPFRSLRDANAAGYRACRVCRPTAIATAGCRLSNLGLTH